MVDTGSGTGDGPVVVVVVVAYSPKSDKNGVDSKLSNVNPVSTTGLDTTFVVTLVSFGAVYSN